MKKRFKSKRKIKVNIIKVIVFLLIAYFSFALTFKMLFKAGLEEKLNNEKVINYLLASSTNNSMANPTLSELLKTDLTSPSALLKIGFNNMINKIDENAYVFSESADEEESEVKTDYIPDPNPKEVEKPLVYIYNTHQRENYSIQNLESYNIKPNVLMASYILKEKLNDLGIPTIVETNDITEILRINNWKYAYSYEASKILLQDAIKKDESLKYFIDLHRDSAKYNSTTAEIEGKKYARILFVVGKEHKNYEKNLAVANKINELIKKENKVLTRGIMVKEGPGVNGIYNQNIHNNVMLIEVGGQHNSIEEVNNTIPILAKVLYSFIKENG